MKKLFSFFAIGTIVLGMASCGKGNDPVVNIVPEGAINGKFSVGENKQVYFSKGNLQASYDGSAWKWFFAENQWDCIGNTSGNIAIDDEGMVPADETVDLFGWSTDATNYGINKSTSSNDYAGEFKDWGNAIGNGWYTMSKDEWKYVFNSRTGQKASTVGATADARYALATVNNMIGIILFPDGGTFEESEFTVVASLNTSNAAYTSTTCTAAQWLDLKTKGCVFLPATGFRYGTNVYSVNYYGNYWMSDPNNADQAYRVAIYNDGVNIVDNMYRYAGYSVRLVREVK